MKWFLTAISEGQRSQLMKNWSYYVRYYTIRYHTWYQGTKQCKSHTSRLRVTSAEVSSFSKRFFVWFVYYLGQIQRPSSKKNELRSWCLWNIFLQYRRLWKIYQDFSNILLVLFSFNFSLYITVQSVIQNHYTHLIVSNIARNTWSI